MFIIVYIAISHLKGEKEEVIKKISLLQEELALIDKHLFDQDRRKSDVEDDKKQAKARIELTSNTLNALKVFLF